MSQIIQQSVKTALLTVLGTTAIIGAHHQYRRRNCDHARLSDYPKGLKSTILNINQAWQAGVTAFMHSYHSSSTSEAKADCFENRVGNQVSMSQAPSLSTHPKVLSVVTQADTDPFLDLLAATSTVKAQDDLRPLAPESWDNIRMVGWVSGVAALGESGFGVVGIDHNSQIVWQTAMPERVHDIVVQPNPIKDTSQKTDTVRAGREVVVMGRRPSEYFWVLDAATGEKQVTVTAQADRHFYGHACFSLDGQYLFVTQNDTVSLSGKIGVYSVAQGYKQIKEFDSFGIGPHELVMHPDGQTLVIANGGIKTEKASREELNLESMQPSLVYLDCKTGQVLEQIKPDHNQMSIRHLAVGEDGTVMIGIQFQGAKFQNVPLVLSHRRGEESLTPMKMPNDEWQCFHQYIASIAVDTTNQLACVTSPIGGCAAVFDLSTRAWIDTIHLPDCAGVATISEELVSITTAEGSSGFIISDGQGSLTAVILDHQAAEKQQLKQGAMSDNKPLQAKSQLTDMVDHYDQPNWNIQLQSVHHKMSFDNHLQAL